MQHLTMVNNKLPAVLERLAHVLMCAKCVELESKFHEEIGPFFEALKTEEDRIKVIEWIVADRETPDEMKDCIEDYRLQARYDLLLTKLGQKTPLTLAHSVGSAHITPAGGNVFLDLGFEPEEAARLKEESLKVIEGRKQ